MNDSDKQLCLWFSSWIGEQYRPSLKPTNVETPDAVDRRTPAVDLAFDIDGHRYVLEHTRVEAFPKRRYQDVKFLEVIYRPLHGRPLGDYLLVCDGDTEKYQQAARNGARAACELIKWITAVGPTLGEHEDRTATLEGVGFEVSLSRKELWLPGRLAVGRRHRKSGRQDQLKAVVKRALTKKLPKLATARRTASWSILLLETDDISTAGPGSLIPAFAAGIKGADGNAPDLVYLVESSLSRKLIATIKHGPIILEDSSVRGWENESGKWPRLPLGA